jgi:pimeloyl-ACP methyl ester carboxylesterase
MSFAAATPNAAIVKGEPVEVRPGRVLSVAVREGAAPDSPTVFLCHGAGGNMNQWRNQWLALGEKGYRQVAWDFMGHGASPQPRQHSAYDGAAFVEDYLAVLARYAGDVNVIAAHSYGTRLTLAALNRADPALADRIRSAVLLGAPPPANFKPMGPIVQWPLFVLTLVRPWLAAGFAKVAWDKGADKALVAYEQEVTKGNSLFMMKALMSQIAPLEVGRLGEIALPVHIIAGATDGLTPPAAGEALSNALPNARFEVFEACGHQIMLEAPQRTTAAIVAAVG